MLNHMFPGDATQVRLSDLKNQFYVAIPTMKNDILAELKSKGMYSVDPESAHAYVLAGILFTAAPFVLAQVLGWGSMLDSPGLLIAAGILAAIIVFLFARIMTAKSLKGVRTKVEILGFQEFINRVDADRHKRMPPTPSRNFCRTPWRWASRTAVPRPSRESPRTSPHGTWGRPPMWDSIPSSSPAPCTPWRWMRTRPLWPRRAPAAAARDGAAAASVAEGSAAAASAAAVVERFRAARCAGSGDARPNSRGRFVGTRELCAVAESRFRSQPNPSLLPPLGHRKR